MTLLSLFSGIGGLDLAVESLLGADTSILCERDPYARRILARHWPGVPIIPDVHTVGDVGADVVFGGPPCQAISAAGKQLGDADPRFLWPEAVRIVGINKPRLCLWENPSAILTHDEGRTFGRHVVEAFARIGFALRWDCAEAAAAGAPHRRDRAWIVCVPVADFTPPEPADSAQTGLFGPVAAAPWPRAGWAAGGRRGTAVARWPRGTRPQVGQGWPTPQAYSHDAEKSNPPGALKLDHVVWEATGDPRSAGKAWPTPRSEDSEQSGARIGRGVADTLTSAARSTATAVRDGSKGGEGRGVIGQTLCDAVEIEGGKHGTWPTPIASNSHPLQEQAWEASEKPAAVGALSPYFSEWLMGVPPGWTEPDGPALPHVAAGWDGDLVYYGGRPAPRGMALLTTEKENRRNRLRCLGNAVVARCAAMAFGALIR